MKICILTQTLDAHVGYGRYAADLVAGLRSLGHEVIVLKERNDSSEGGAVLARGWRLFLVAWRTRSLMRRCDVIHALDGYPYGVIAALATIGTHTPLIISAMGTYAVAPLYRWRTARLLRWAYRRARRVVAISRYTRDEILKRVPLRNTLVINCGIDLARFLREHHESPERFILSVGAVEDRKGYHISVPAFAHIAKQFPGLRYHIVGRKERWYFEELQDMIRRKGIADRVLFHEGLSDEELAEMYRTARLFVLASMNVEGHHFEGFGLVYLEAAAAGTPVIGTRGSGPEDAIADGQNGLLVPQGDIEATARAMRTILSDPIRQKAMSEAGHRWARQHALESMIREYDELYRSL